MIRRLTLDELIDAAKNLPSAEQFALITAISQQLMAIHGDDAGMPASASRQDADNWVHLGIDSLSRVYGEQEPDYSDRDLLP